MPSLRMQFPMRWLMLFVVVAAFLCTYLAAWQASRIGSQTAREVSISQREVTSSILNDVRSKSTDSWGRCAEAGGGSPSATGLGWYMTVKVWKGNDTSQTPAIDLEVSGGYDGSKLRPIRIKHRAERGRTEYLEALTRAYKERGWQYKIAE
ncbi:hypothetical protein ACYOEI_13670 [Singulisphaera rosea]